MAEPACKDCKFWERVRIGDVPFEEDDDTSDANLGQCCRYPPPTPRSDGDTTDEWAFPITFFTSWCGEFQPK